MPKYADNHCNRIAGRVGKEWGMKNAGKKKAKRSKELIKKAKSRGKAPMAPHKEAKSKELIKKAKARGPAPPPPRRSMRNKKY